MDLCLEESAESATLMATPRNVSSVKESFTHSDTNIGE